MARPLNSRMVGCLPECTYFKPKGVPQSSLEVIVLRVDEFEAIRLADHEGLYQDEAAKRMNVSRQTFGRIIENGHRKVAQALVKGQAIKIEGGEFEMTAKKFRCLECKHEWEVPYGTGRPEACPSCSGNNIHRAAGDQGRGRKRHGKQEGGNCRRKKGQSCETGA
ncbi:MAG: DUF134 domain-containing protein [Proteobacteria bacterium]|nr:DUF134 domain-containing protein [Pseudomonadota bacterium]MBU1737570.1 DUF134 domain-containing protein [Pseudomonadota bacterium]